MSTPIIEYDYELPRDRIAQSPAQPRESAKLMLVDKTTHAITHRTVGDLHTFLTDTDVLVINNTKVFKARLRGISPSGVSVEIFLIRPNSDGLWIALGKPGKKIQIGDTIQIADNFNARIVNKTTDGSLVISFDMLEDEVITLANLHGEIPIPPYIKTIPTDGSYQTVYATQTGSVAAPTAGFHLSKNLLDIIGKKGVQIVEITLHVGIGTFMPIKSGSLETHEMHSEWVHVSKKSAQQINEAKKQHKRIIAIGTTTVRTLEGVASMHGGTLKEYSGDVSLFITPGFTFNIVDSIFTNFHLPKSTLLVLVSAFAGIPIIQEAYKSAIQNNYRFYSFGDAMLIT